MRPCWPRAAAASCECTFRPRCPKRCGCWARRPSGRWPDFQPEDSMSSIDAIVSALGDKADYYLKFDKPKIAKDRLHVPGPDWVDRIFGPSDRSNRVLNNL